MKEYPPTKQCQICQKVCCKLLPGACVPEDLMRMYSGGTLEEAVNAALKSGRFSIDWYEGGLPSYFIRPATKGKEGVVRDPSWGGICTFLTNKGCSLEFEKRPLICRALKPGKEANDICRTPSIKGSQKLFAANRWEDSEVNLGRI